MVKLGTHIGNLFFHFKVAGALVVVPLEFDPCVQVAFLVDCYAVVLFDGVEQVIGVALAYILNAKIIRFKDENYWLPLVAPQARGDDHWY